MVFIIILVAIEANDEINIFLTASFWYHRVLFIVDKSECNTEQGTNKYKPQDTNENVHHDI